MNVPIRALSWAIRFFWLITLAFAITCVYSAAQIGVEFGPPTATSAGEGLGTVLPITLNNGGYYRISDMNITTTLVDTERIPVSEASSYLEEIPPQSEITILHRVIFDLDAMLARPEYLFNDTDLTMHGSIQLNYASLIPFKIEADASIPWGGPLFDFTTEMPQYTSIDAARQRVRIPFSFENHSPYTSVTGTIRMELLNSRDQLLGESTVFVDVPSNAAYNGEFETLVHGTTVTREGEIHVYFETEVFDYGPVVTNYG